MNQGAFINLYKVVFFLNDKERHCCVECLGNNQSDAISAAYSIINESKSPIYSVTRESFKQKGFNTEDLHCNIEYVKKWKKN